MKKQFTNMPEPPKENIKLLYDIELAEPQDDEHQEDPDVFPQPFRSQEIFTYSLSNKGRLTTRIFKLILN